MSLLLNPNALLEPTPKRARRLVELLVLALQGSLLVRHAPPEVADAGLRFASSGATPVSSSGRSPQTQISMS